MSVQNSPSGDNARHSSSLDALRIVVSRLVEYMLQTLWTTMSPRTQLGATTSSLLGLPASIRPPVTRLSNNVDVTTVRAYTHYAADTESSPIFRHPFEVKVADVRLGMELVRITYTFVSKWSRST